MYIYLKCVNGFFIIYKLKHCIAGYENALQKSISSYQTPTAKNIDLKSAAAHDLFNNRQNNQQLTIVSCNQP